MLPLYPISEDYYGGEGVRTLDPQLAKLVLSQLSYAPDELHLIVYGSSYCKVGK